MRGTGAKRPTLGDTQDEDKNQGPPVHTTEAALYNAPSASDNHDRTETPALPSRPPLLNLGRILKKKLTSLAARIQAKSAANRGIDVVHRLLKPGKADGTLGLVAEAQEHWMVCSDCSRVPLPPDEPVEAVAGPILTALAGSPRPAVLLLRSNSCSIVCPLLLSSGEVPKTRSPITTIKRRRGSSAKLWRRTAGIPGNAL